MLSVVTVKHLRKLCFYFLFDVRIADLLDFCFQFRPRYRIFCLFRSQPENAADAEQLVAEHLETLEQTAQQLVWDEGYSYAVKAQLVEMPFDDRTYGEWTMPAGDYEALRITIGEAAGQNWWCVMYPSLCVPNACEVTADEETAQEAFGKSEQDMLQHHERYAVKLKCGRFSVHLSQTLFRVFHRSGR